MPFDIIPGTHEHNIIINTTWISNILLSAGVPGSLITFQNFRFYSVDWEYRVEVLRSYRYTAFGVDVPILFGDVNADGFVGLLDTNMLLTYLNGRRDSLPNRVAADVNRDGVIDMTDLGMILDYTRGRTVTLGGMEESDNPWRFQGMYWDAHAGTYMAHHRRMNPRTGRWNQPDPWFHPLGGGGLSCPSQSGNLFVAMLNNPVFWQDPTGLKVRLGGYWPEGVAQEWGVPTATLSDKTTILGYLQQLTNHRLYFNSAGYVGISLLYAYGNNLASGNTLISRLINDPNHTVRIYMRSIREPYFKPDVQFHPRLLQSGSGGRVIINPFVNFDVPTRDAIGIVSMKYMPTHLTLGHELIHADRAMRQVSFASTNTVRHTFPIGITSRRLFGFFGPRVPSVITTTQVTRREEMATIGLGNFHTTNCVTENMLRSEHGLNLRGAHWW